MLRLHKNSDAFHLAKLSDQKFAQYTLTHFLFIHLIREVLDRDQLGRQFFSNPSAFINLNKGRERLRYCIDNIAKVLARTLDSEHRRRNKDDQFFDYKTELKNSKAVAEITDSVMLKYDVLVDDDSAKVFSDLWISSEDLV
jgi:hypothetical protein